MNGTNNPTTLTSQDTNGHASELHLIRGVDGEPSIEELESELDIVQDGQVELGDLLSRVVQQIYAELTEMAETLPSMSDPARKRAIADWVVKTKKQVVKLYAVMKWSRDAADVQKAMNVTGFLMAQNQQFEEAIQSMTNVKEGLAPARLRNHDLLTALDVLTSGSYRRLPSQIKKFFINPPPLSDDEVAKALRDMEEHIRYRLRMNEIIPMEMSQYRIEDGRVFFYVPNLFETSLSLRGAQKDDGWFFVHVEFLHGVGGDLTEVQEFPDKPPEALKRHITVEADNRLNYYTPVPVDPNAAPSQEPPPPPPQLPAGTVDTPLVRLFNFLQMMSLSYQLEILLFQAQRLISLGWREYLSIEKSRDRKSFKASYWIRPSPNAPGRPISIQNRPKIPPIGGTVTVSLVETRCTPKAGGGPRRSPRDRILAILQKDGKFSGARPSDEVETFRIEVKWEPTKVALGVILPPELEWVNVEELEVNAQDLDFEAILRKAIMRHINAILTVYKSQLESGQYRAMFSAPGEVSLVVKDGFAALKLHLCADEYITVSIDPRTGQITLRDTGGLAAAGRAPRYAMFSDKINENPFIVYNILVGARFDTIIELAEQKAQYLGLQTFRTRNLPREEIMKFGPEVRMYLFIQLAISQGHYLVLLVTELEFRFALISVQVLSNSPTGNMFMKDIGWLDVQRIHSGDILVRDTLNHFNADGPQNASPSGRETSYDLGGDRFRLETEVLRELYAYCCARVSYTNVELQLKLRSIPYTYLSPNAISLSSELDHLQTSLARSIPGLCVQSSDILAGAPAAEAAMPNIRVIPLNWWSTKKSQVVTCVKLKYVQQPVGKRAGTSTVIRPSKRIIYDTREAIVSFLSENVDTCVDEFLEEWAKVSKMVVIAREVAQMSKTPSWKDVRLLSFDLQTVEFSYAKDYTVSITCSEQLLPSTNSSYELYFSRIPRRLGRSLVHMDSIDPLSSANGLDDDDHINPHDEAEPFLRHVLRHGPQLSSSLHQLVGLLRDSLPLVCVVDSIRRGAESGRDKDAVTVGVDVFAKAAGWLRVLYGDLRHALDFRLLTGRRVAILDAGRSTTLQMRKELSPLGSSMKGNPDQIKTPTLSAKGKPGQNPITPSKLGKLNEKTAPNVGQEKYPLSADVGILQSIPNFTSIVREAVREALSSGPSSKTSTTPGTTDSPADQFFQQTLKHSRIAQIDVGVICDVDAVDPLAGRLHAQVLRTLVAVKQGSLK